MGFRLLGYLLRALPFGLLAWFLAVMGWLGYAVAVLLILGVLAGFALSFLGCIAYGNWLVDEGRKRQASRKYANMTPEQRAAEVAAHKRFAERGF